MNKNVIIGVISLVIIVIIAAVAILSSQNNKDTSSTNTENKSNQSNIENTEENVISNQIENQNILAEEQITNNNNKILIAYFSRADENYSVGTVDVGNTEIMAGFIKDYLGDKADTFKIDPVKAYPTNYKECTEVATKEKDTNARPEYKNAESLDISKYDTIFIRFPCVVAVMFR